MRFLLQRHIHGQTPYGIFHNLCTQCEGIKYLAVHVRTVRLTVMWGAE